VRSASCVRTTARMCVDFAGEMKQSHTETKRSEAGLKPSRRRNQGRARDRLRDRPTMTAHPRRVYAPLAFATGAAPDGVHRVCAPRRRGLVSGFTALTLSPMMLARLCCSSTKSDTRRSTTGSEGGLNAMTQATGACCAGRSPRAGWWSSAGWRPWSGGTFLFTS